MSKCTTTATALAVATATAANRVCMCCAGFCESVYCTRFDCCCLCAYTFKWALFYVDCGCIFSTAKKYCSLSHIFFLHSLVQFECVWESPTEWTSIHLLSHSHMYKIEFECYGLEFHNHIGMCINHTYHAHIHTYSLRCTSY